MCFSSSDVVVSESLKFINDAEELPIDAFFHDVPREASASTSSLAIPRSGRHSIGRLVAELASFIWTLWNCESSSRRYHAITQSASTPFKYICGPHDNFVVSFWFVSTSSHQKGINSSNWYCVRQVAIECVNAIVSNSILLGMPQDQSVYGLIIIGTIMRVVRVRKFIRVVNKFHVAISPELSTKDSSKDSESTSAWFSTLLNAVSAYGIGVEKALQEQIKQNQSLTLSHLLAYDGYGHLSHLVNDTDQWFVVNATPCKATVVKFDEDGSPVQFGCVHLGGPVISIIEHPRGRGPQWTMVFPLLFAVADPGGVNILKFDTAPSPNSIRLDQFVLLALEEILNVQQFDSDDPNVEKMVHGDVRLPNFLFNSDNGNPSLCLIDFEYSSSAHARQTLITSARADRPQIPPPLRFQRGNDVVPSMPSDDFYMFLYSLLLEIDFSCQTRVIRGKIEFGYDDFSPCISKLSEFFDAQQGHLFVELLRPIAPNPPPEYQSVRKQGELREILLVYEDQLYKEIRSHCKRIRSGDFANLSLYGHPSELFVVKRFMGSRVVKSTVNSQ
ncbi:hypothetical protein GEMRC1_006126 [Eukaryota sp. GEM-RC1]